MKLLKQLLEATDPSPHNVDATFTVGRVKFDNESGLGSTPMGQNILYQGAVAWMTPTTFRRLATAADRGDTSTELLKLVKGGKSIACPFLQLDIIGVPKAPELVKVEGHEGRARADVFKELNGDVPMPVQLFPAGLRARHLCPEFFAWLQEHGLQAERSERTVKLGATMYYWDGQVINISKT